MKKFVNVLLLLITTLFSCLLFGQKTLIYKEPYSEYQQGMDLFNKEKFNAAQECFYKTIDAISDEQSELRINAEYYAAICAIELYNNDAAYQIKQFINNHAESPKCKTAYFQFAKLQYRQKKYKEASTFFEMVNEYDLTDDELAEFYFKSGYSYFMLKDDGNAKKRFAEITETDTKYFAAANYFYGHINYQEKNYDVAKKSFLKIENDEDFGSVAKYYIAQIYYIQGKYEQVISYAQTLPDSANAKRSDEIARIIGESYFKTSKYTEAIPFLKKYISKTTNQVTRQDYYQLGYACYKSGTDYTGAINNFKLVTPANDSLMQNTYYLLADCYLKTNNKKFALTSFQAAYKYSFYPDISEDALFNYAKLSYDLANNPYNEAIIYLQKYINDYPNSARIDEAYNYLINLYLTTKNYKEALTSIEKIKVKNDKLNQAYQKIAYYRGVELFNDQQLDGAMELFDKSNSMPMDKTIKAQCYYWKGEAFYRFSQFDSARTWYDNFLILPGSYSLPEYNTANYNIGYCYFKKKDYKNAGKSFRKFVTNKSTEKDKLINDAYLRIGDCYFISKDYAEAAKYYDMAIVLKIFDTDYAIFQKALCLGAQGKYDAKISSLVNLLDQYPKTAYTDDAKFELANTFLLKNDNDEALEYYKKIINDYPNSSYVKKSLLKIGLIYYNTDKNDLALTVLKQVVNDFPATEESKDALVSIRNIYMEQDKVDSFYVYVKSLPFEYGSKTEQDSITYMAAEKRYMSGDCDKAVNGFGSYLIQFPNGYFVTNANYYKAECEFKNNNTEDALKSYIFVANQPQNKFSEYAILKTADILFNLKRYDSAATYYSMLENNADYKANILDTRTMKMRCYTKSGQNDKSVAAARALIATDKVTEESLAEAHLTIARAAMQMDSIALAQTEFEITYKLSPTSEFGAEAKYNMALIEYKLQDYTKAEKMVFEVINLVPSYDYWVAKSFILLADVYIKTDNVFQAKATLQSIIDNSDNTELVKIAHEKLNAITTAGKIETPEESPEDTIEFNNNSNDEKLFDENKKEDNKNE